MNWARKEIERAKEETKKENGLYQELACATYDSALKAYDALLEDGHSDFSIHLTMDILNRLVKGLPLVKITEENAEWKDVTCEKDNNEKTYQSTRFTALFKKVKVIDGKDVIKYKDIHRTMAVNVHNPSCCYTSGLVDSVIDEITPVEFPYYPSTTPIKVYTEDFLAFPENGDFDTVGVLYAIYPTGERKEINRYFHLDGKTKTEIDKTMYNLLKENKK